MKVIQPHSEIAVKSESATKATNGLPTLASGMMNRTICLHFCPLRAHLGRVDLGKGPGPFMLWFDLAAHQTASLST